MPSPKLLSLGDLALCMSQTLLLQLHTIKACTESSNAQHCHQQHHNRNNVQKTARMSDSSLFLLLLKLAFLLS